MVSGGQVKEVSAAYRSVRQVDDCPEGYKRTEIGVIPGDWDMLMLGSICTLVNGRGFKPFEWSEHGLPIIRIQNLNGSDEFNYYEGYYDPKIFIEYGQLLFAWSGSRGTSFGPHIWSGEDALLNYHTWKMVTHTTKIESSFFFHALKALTKIIEDSAHGASALVHTQKGEMEKFYFPAPSDKKEQTAIAKALSDVDALITSLEKLIAKKRAIKTAAMQQLLTGKKRLPPFDQVDAGYKQTELGEIPGDWGVGILGDVIAFKNGAAHESAISKNGDYTVVNSKFISTEGAVAKYSNQLLCPTKKGNILMVMSDVPNGRAIAKCFVVDADDQYTVNQRICSMESLGVESKFLFYILDRNKYHLQFDDGVKQTNLRRQDVLNCPIFMPSLDEQATISEVLTVMDNDITTLDERLVKTKNLKQATMQQLLTGKTRLI